MSKIKVAFIPPRGMTELADRGSMIMCLAQLLGDDTYSEDMRKLSNDKFTLMDNGANEGRVLSPAALAAASEGIYTNEIVLPDVLDETDATLEASRAYLKKHFVPGMNYMGVVQGTNLQELMRSIDMYDTMYTVTTLGFPRRLLKRIETSVRINLAHWVDEFHPGRFQIHFLGACSSWVKEPLYASRYAPNVRSIDTSLPFNYGLAGVLISDHRGVTKEKIDRPEGYFERWYEANPRTTVAENLRIYKGWCDAKKAPAGQL